MVVLVTCKNEENPIKYEGARVVPAIHTNFSDAQGQLILFSVTGFGCPCNLRG